MPLTDNSSSVGFTRREVLVGTTLLVACKTKPVPRDQEQLTLRAVLAQMLPGSDTFDYVRAELEKPYMGRVRSKVKQALIALTETSKRDLGHDYADLDESRQERMLERFAANQLGFGKNLDTTQAFNQLRALAFEGHFGR